MHRNLKFLEIEVHYNLSAREDEILMQKKSRLLLPATCDRACDQNTMHRRSSTGWRESIATALYTPTYTMHELVLTRVWHRL